MKNNKNFAKLKAYNTPEWGPVPLVVVTHHHEEWDEPVFDPETGEPVIDPATGEQKTEHMTRDWDTSESKLCPTAADYRQMNYLPVVDNPPSDPAPKGYHYEQCGYTTAEDGESIICQYEPIANPPRKWSRRSMKTALVTAGKWDAVKEMLVAIDKYEDLLMCDYIEETNIDFKSAYDAAVREYGKEAVDEIVDTISIEE